jgi:hypothetical protein
MPYLLTMANRNDPICHAAQGGQGKHSCIAVTGIIANKCRQCKRSLKDASGIRNDNSRVMLQIVALLTDNSRGVIYRQGTLIEQEGSIQFTSSLRLLVCFAAKVSNILYIK